MEPVSEGMRYWVSHQDKVSELGKQDISPEVKSETQEQDRESGMLFWDKVRPKISHMTSRLPICSGQDSRGHQGVPPLQGVGL